MRQNDIQVYNQKQQELYAAKTGISVDIQNIGKNTQTIVFKTKRSLEEIYKGVWLNTEIMELEDGNFTNIYDLFWSQKNPDLSCFIDSAKRPYYLFDYIKSNPSILAVINGSFFFLIDVVDKIPKDYPYHFCIRDGKVVGLPSSNEPIIFVKGQKLNVKEPKSIGTIKIADQTITWIGSKSNIDKKNINEVILYNSGSSKLIKQYDPKTGVRMGTLDHTCIHTPSNPTAVDLVINADTKGDLKITKINLGGNTHFFDGLFILQIDSKKNKYKIGDKVIPLTLDGLNLRTISSGVTIGKSITDRYFFVPERINSRDARSVIAEDITGNIHFLVFDGSKYIPKFKGVSAKDIATYLSPSKFKWAYFLDGGSSSRIILKDGSSYKFLANEFAFKKITNEIFLWDWKRHRRLASSIGLKVKID